jgi:hypothetical protein
MRVTVSAVWIKRYFIAHNSGAHSAAGFYITSLFVKIIYIYIYIFFNLTLRTKKLLSMKSSYKFTLLQVFKVQTPKYNFYAFPKSGSLLKIRRPTIEIPLPFRGS